MSILYGTFVMRNDSFIPGALVLAYALKKQGIDDSVVCFITDEVSDTAASFLREVYDEVILIPSVKIDHPNQKGRQDRSYLFTRLEVLKQMKYNGQTVEKIILLDSDILPLRNYRLLKEVKAHAAIINESKDTTAEIEDHQYIVSDKILETGQWRWHEIYHDVPHGHPVPTELTTRVLEDPLNLGMNTSIWILKPDQALYKSMMSDLKQDSTLETIQSFNWPEMQYLTYRLSGSWHNIDIKYASFNGYPRIDLVNGIHYAGVKPWAISHRSFKHYSRFPDFRLWQAIFIKMMKEWTILNNYPKLGRLKEQFQMQFKTAPVTPSERHHTPDWV